MKASNTTTQRALSRRQVMIGAAGLSFAFAAGLPAKAAVTIVPGTTYNFRLTLDGAHFILSVDGVEKIRMPASGNPFGNVDLLGRRRLRDLG